MLFSRYAAQKLLAVIHDYRQIINSTKKANFFRRKILRLRHEIWCTLSGADIEIGATIGRNLQLPHPNGVVINGRAVIGDNCMIMQQVTIGMIGHNEVPRIGSGVYIGAGAKVIGAVDIGDKAAIGANAVVLQNVPSSCTAVGIPARIVRKTEN